MERLKDWFIGELLRNTSKEKDALRILLLYNCTLYYFFFTFIVQLAVTSLDVRYQLILSLLAGISCLAPLFLLKYARSLKKAAYVFITGNFIASAASVFVYHGGEIEITSGIWFVILYLVANLTLGGKAGMTFLAATFTFLCIVITLNLLKFQFLAPVCTEEEYKIAYPFIIGNAFIVMYYLTNQYIKTQKILEESLFTALKKAETLNKELLANEEEIRQVNEYQQEIIRKLEESEENQKMAQETAKIGSWDVDVLNEKLHWSDETYRIHDLPASFQPDVESAINFYDEASRPVMKKAVEDSILTGRPWDLQLKIITAKGESKWVRAIGRVRHEKGQVTHVYGVFQDINEEKEKELALEHYRKGLESLNRIASNVNLCWGEQLSQGLKVVAAYLDLSLGIISKIDGNAFIIKHFYSEDEKFAFSRDQALNLENAFCSIIYKASGCIAISYVGRSEYKDHPCYKAYKLEAYIGAPIWVNGKKYGTVSFTSPRPKEAGFSQYDINFMQLLSTWIGSVMEREIYEKEILAAKEAAEKASAAKAEFLSTMSHEIRTPMNAVIGMSHLLLQENPLPHQVENLQALRFSSENLLALINDILDFSKIEAGRIAFEAIEFQISELINSVKQSITYRAEEKGIQLKIDLSPQLPEVVIGDPTRLSQILYNLVGNAVKFTHEGHVEIAVHVAQTCDDVATLHFSINDTGIGIAPENLTQIFDSFSQASQDITRKFGGTGLGLTITKRLLELQGSEIKVESEVGKGTCFHFLLPHKVVKNKPALKADLSAEAQLIDTAQLSEVRILLAEDNPVNVMVASKFLNKWGVHLEVAENGAIALEKVASATFDLVLMDLKMPVMDGYEASREIRKLLPGLPIIALTASATLEAQEKVFKAGMNGFITKPFNPNELQKLIMKHCGQKSSAKF